MNALDWTRTQALPIHAAPTFGAPLLTATYGDVAEGDRVRGAYRELLDDDTLGPDGEVLEGEVSGVQYDGEFVVVWIDLDAVDGVAGKMTRVLIGEPHESIEIVDTRSHNHGDLEAWQ